MKTLLILLFFISFIAPTDSSLKLIESHNETAEHTFDLQGELEEESSNFLFFDRNIHSYRCQDHDCINRIVNKVISLDLDRYQLQFHYPNAPPYLS